jgi:single-strand DNA-binding protein
MANLNKVLLIGRLTRDPETRSTGGGSSVVQLGLAVNRTYTRRDSGEKVEETCFVDVEAWGRTGETIARYMKKGRQIFIEGRLKFDSWEKDGQRRSKLSVVCDTFQFIDSQGGGGGGGEGRSKERSQQGGAQQGGAQQGGAQQGGAQQGSAAPVGAQTPQDDYADDDIPF